ncbi:hypothetical protein [Amycolatopsis sp. NPDC098790]|uniref:hypothetical protein n=1 Tax=Amycolatopsis sp. NPDC098790 TaxID=3363939 RepID=UPI003818A32D
MNDLADAAVTITIASVSYSALRLAVFGYIVRQGQRKAPPESQVKLIEASARLGTRLPDSGASRLWTHFRRRR